MRIEYEGQPYEFDMGAITVKQAIKIEKHLGCPVSEFSERLFPSAEEGKEPKQPDMLAMQCLGWLILHEGRGVPIDDCDFKVAALIAAIAAAAPPSPGIAPGAEPPVPTMAAGTSANGAGTADGQLIAR